MKGRLEELQRRRDVHARRLSRTRNPGHRSLSRAIAAQENAEASATLKALGIAVRDFAREEEDERDVVRRRNAPLRLRGGGRSS